MSIVDEYFSVPLFPRGPPSFDQASAVLPSLYQVPDQVPDIVDARQVKSLPPAREFEQSRPFVTLPPNPRPSLAAEAFLQSSANDLPQPLKPQVRPPLVTVPFKVAKEEDGGMSTSPPTYHHQGERLLPDFSKEVPSAARTLPAMVAPPQSLLPQQAPAFQSMPPIPLAHKLSGPAVTHSVVDSAFERAFDMPLSSSKLPPSSQDSASAQFRSRSGKSTETPALVEEVMGREAELKLLRAEVDNVSLEVHRLQDLCRDAEMQLQTVSGSASVASTKAEMVAGGQQAVLQATAEHSGNQVSALERRLAQMEWELAEKKEEVAALREAATTLVQSIAEQTYKLQGLQLRQEQQGRQVALLARDAATSKRQQAAESWLQQAQARSEMIEEEELLNRQRRDLVLEIERAEQEITMLRARARHIQDDNKVKVEQNGRLQKRLEDIALEERLMESVAQVGLKAAEEQKQVALKEVATLEERLCHEQLKSSEGSSLAFTCEQAQAEAAQSQAELAGLTDLLRTISRTLQTPSSSNSAGQLLDAFQLLVRDLREKGEVLVPSVVLLGPGELQIAGAVVRYQTSAAGRVCIRDEADGGLIPLEDMLRRRNLIAKVGSAALPQALYTTLEPLSLRGRSSPPRPSMRARSSSPVVRGRGQVSMVSDVAGSTLKERRLSYIPPTLPSQPLQATVIRPSAPGEAFPQLSQAWQPLPARSLSPSRSVPGVVVRSSHPLVLSQVSASQAVSLTQSPHFAPGTLPQPAASSPAMLLAQPSIQQQLRAPDPHHRCMWTQVPGPQLNQEPGMHGPCLRVTTLSSAKEPLVSSRLPPRPPPSISLPAAAPAGPILVLGSPSAHSAGPPVCSQPTVVYPLPAHRVTQEPSPTLRQSQAAPAFHSSGPYRQGAGLSSLQPVHIGGEGLLHI